MFRVMGEAGRDCTGLTRRSFVQAGMLGLGGLGLADLFRMRAAAEAPAGDTAVILFWLSGGPRPRSIVGRSARSRRACQGCSSANCFPSRRR
jgi:hypothetical protein